MSNITKNKWVDYAVFGLSIFLVFCLLFDAFIALPNWVSWLGRWHPLALHFPIVLLLICAFLGLTGKPIPKLLLRISVLFALATAISGFFLGKDVPQKGDLLFWHQWLGGGLALLAAVWYSVEESSKKLPNLSKAMQAVLVVLIGLTGHYGGMVTHGEDFLALPTEKRAKEIPENPLVYGDIAARILEDKCVSCHNPNKTKGGLLMTSLNGLLAGGEVGNTVVAGKPEESELLRRLHLPVEDEEHMPPEGKQPLTDNEISILERWIALGASDTLQYASLAPSEPLKGLIANLMQPDATEKWTSLPKIADTTLARLNTDYVTITRIANDENALSVNIYNSPVYSPLQITNLTTIHQNIVQLDISGLPISKEELAFVATCSNITWLELDKTPIKDADILVLQSLTKLELLKIHSTSISDDSLPVLEKLTNLKQLYVWNTAISNEGILSLTKTNPMLKIEKGLLEGEQVVQIDSAAVVQNR